MQITQSVQKWGNGSGVRLPQKVLKAAHIHIGQDLAVSLHRGAIVLTPMINADEQSLESLVNRITPSNIHTEIDWGEPKGKEIW